MSLPRRCFCLIIQNKKKIISISVHVLNHFWSWTEMHGMRACRRHDQWFKVKRMTRKSVVLNRIFTSAHFDSPTQTNNRLRPETIRALSVVDSWHLLLLLLIMKGIDSLGIIKTGKKRYKKSAVKNNFCLKKFRN